MQHHIQQLLDNIVGVTTMSDNLIFIGTKPLMNYVTAVVMQFTTKNAESIAVKARGKFISRAVDVAEVATKRFLEGQVVIRRITTNSEEFTTTEGKQVRVSSLEIMLGRPSASSSSPQIRTEP